MPSRLTIINWCWWMCEKVNFSLIGDVTTISARCLHTSETSLKISLRYDHDDSCGTFSDSFVIENLRFYNDLKVRLIYIKKKKKIQSKSQAECKCWIPLDWWHVFIFSLGNIINADDSLFFMQWRIFSVSGVNEANPQTESEFTGFGHLACTQRL